MYTHSILPHEAAALPDASQPVPEVEEKEPGGRESSSAHLLLSLNDPLLYHLGFPWFPSFLDQTSDYDALFTYASRLKNQVSLAPVSLQFTNQWPMLNVFYSFFILFL